MPQVWEIDKMVMKAITGKVKDKVEQVVPDLILGPEYEPKKELSDFEKGIKTLEKVDSILDKGIPLVERIIEKIDEHKDKKKKGKTTGNPQDDYLKELGIGEMQG